MQQNVVLIPLMVLAPLFFAAALLLPVKAFEDRRAAGTFTLGATLITFVLSLLVAAQYHWNAPAGFQLAGTLPWMSSFGLSFSFGVDGISLWLVLLTTFMMPAILLASPDTRPPDRPGGRSGERPLGGDAADNALARPGQAARQFYFWLLMVEAGSLATFVATDALFFFVGFEFTLIPLYFLIGIYGGRERLTAARVFFIYTFAGSMLTFAGLLYIAWFNHSLTPQAGTAFGTWTFDIGALYGAARMMSFTQQAWVLIALLAGFAVKVPLFPLHTWLPITYTEAPMAGTVVLAAVLAKLGTYGLLRFALPMCPRAVVAFAPAIGILAVIGILYAALICWVQNDLKRLVAYSSISHLGFIVLGLFALDPQNFGATGATIYMINHGLATGALFLCVGLIRKRLDTTDLRAMSGLVRLMPVWALFTVFFVMAAVGLPGLNGFVGEFLTLLGTFVSTHVLGMVYGGVAGLGVILGAIYLLYMVARVVFGPLKLPVNLSDLNIRDLTGREIAALAPLAAACLFLGLYPFPALRSLERPVRAMTVAAQREIHNPAEHATAHPPAAPTEEARATLTAVHRSR